MAPTAFRIWTALAPGCWMPEAIGPLFLRILLFRLLSCVPSSSSSSCQTRCSSNRHDADVSPADIRAPLAYSMHL